jgi:hypothetical protein
MCQTAVISFGCSSTLKLAMSKRVTDRHLFYHRLATIARVG